MADKMNRQINHKTMRVVVGLIAFWLAPTVFWLADAEQPIYSISSSYWTNSHDLFVGSLFAVGFFLFAYNGQGEKRDREFYLSKASCVFAVLVATFPTKGSSETHIPPTWASSVAEAIHLEVNGIHYGSAILFFACLLAMMWFFSERALSKGKKNRAYAYRFIAVTMSVGMILIFALGSLLEFDRTVLWVEAWGLMWFGVGWLLAGSYKDDPLASSSVAAT